jgi:hypothetical protein
MRLFVNPNMLQSGARCMAGEVNLATYREDGNADVGTDACPDVIDDLGWFRGFFTTRILALSVVLADDRACRTCDRKHPQSSMWLALLCRNPPKKEEGARQQALQFPLVQVAMKYIQKLAAFVNKLFRMDFNGMPSEHGSAFRERS